MTLSAEIAIGAVGLVITIVSWLLAQGRRQGRHQRALEEISRDVADHEQRLRVIEKNVTEIHADTKWTRQFLMGAVNKRPPREGS